MTQSSVTDTKSELSEVESEDYDIYEDQMNKSMIIENIQEQLGDFKKDFVPQVESMAKELAS